MVGCLRSVIYEVSSEAVHSDLAMHLTAVQVAQSEKWRTELKYEHTQYSQLSSMTQKKLANQIYFVDITIE